MGGRIYNSVIESIFVKNDTYGRDALRYRPDVITGKAVFT